MYTSSLLGVAALRSWAITTVPEPPLRKVVAITETNDRKNTSQNSCLSPLPADVLKNRGAFCFASYCGWLPDEHSEASCARDVGMKWPSMFLSRGRAGSLSAGEHEDTAEDRTTEMSYESLLRRDPRLGNLYRFQTANRLEAFQNPCYQSEPKSKQSLRFNLKRCSGGPPESFNASLTIVGARASVNGSGRTAPQGGYFVDLADLDRKCGERTGKALLADMVFFDFLAFVWKEWRSSSSAKVHRPPLSESLTPDRLRRIFFCAHRNYSKIEPDHFDASVPYLHLHSTERDDYPEFLLESNVHLRPSTLGGRDSWDKYGAVCVRNTVGSDSVSSLVENVAAKLWEFSGRGMESSFAEDLSSEDGPESSFAEEVSTEGGMESFFAEEVFE